MGELRGGRSCALKVTLSPPAMAGKCVASICSVGLCESTRLIVYGMERSAELANISLVSNFARQCSI